MKALFYLLASISFLALFLSFAPGPKTTDQTKSISSRVLASPPVSRKAVTLSSLSVSFETNDNDKDDDSMLDLVVRKDDFNIGELECCNDTRFGDQSRTDYMNVPLSYTDIGYGDLDHITLQMGLRANGNDEWKFNVRLHGVLSDGQPINWTVTGFDLASHASQYVYSDRIRLSDHRD